MERWNPQRPSAQCHGTEMSGKVSLHAHTTRESSEETRRVFASLQHRVSSMCRFMTIGFFMWSHITKFQRSMKSPK